MYEILILSVAKIKLDDYNFYGEIIHVFYAPEFENIEDLREKLEERRFIVDLKCKKYNEMDFGTSKYDLMMKTYADKLRPRKKKTNKKKILNKTTSSLETNEDLLINEPKLPENWIKSNSLTGDKSYDQTVHNIRLQLKSTIVSILNKILTPIK